METALLTMENESELRPSPIRKIIGLTVGPLHHTWVTVSRNTSLYCFSVLFPKVYF